MTTFGRSPFVLLAATLAVAATAGCVDGGLAFREDDLVTFTAPIDGATVELPASITWSAGGLGAGDEPARFAVFVDRAPVAPGADLASVASGDVACERTDGCPDAAYLAQRGVYTASGTSVVFETVPDNRPAERPQDPDDHEATVVLVDAGGRRLGEAFWSIDFTVDRAGRPVGAG